MFNPFHSKNRPTHSSRSLRQKLRLISLESRCVPSITPVLEGGHLMIQGTQEDDLIDVRLDSTESMVVVTNHGVLAGQFALESVQRIEVHGGEGNDRIYLSHAIWAPSLIDGGAGNDQLFAGWAGSNARSRAIALRPGHPSVSGILIGGAGDDLLSGTNDRDMLIGGDGRDVIHGNGAEDIVMAGRSFVDGNSRALFSLMANWNSTDAYVDRVANVRREMESMIPPDHDMTFVYYDGSADVLHGGAGRDWFFSGESVRIVDWTLGEEIE